MIAALDIAEGLVGFGVFGVGSDGSLKGRLGLGFFAQAIVGKPHGVEGLGVLRVEFEGLGEIADGLAVFLLAEATDGGLVVELSQLFGGPFGFGAQRAGGNKAADGLVVFVEHFIGLGKDVVGVAISGVDGDGQFQFDGGVAIGALLHQFVAGAEVVEGFRSLSQGGRAQ